MRIAARADIDITVSSYVISVYINEEITMDDYRKLETISNKADVLDLIVGLNSSGGDVYSAIKIGLLIRQFEGSTIVGLGGTCYSACALIYVSGVSRQNYGDIGLYKPYIGPQTMSREQIETQFPLMMKDIMDYVREMRVTDEFYREIIDTPPENMIVYRREEIYKIVPVYDPMTDEIFTSDLARIYGISTFEYRRRNSVADARCVKHSAADIDEAIWWCRESIMWNLKIDDYRKRLYSVQRVCWYSRKKRYSSDDEDTLSNTPRRERFELPFRLKVESCERRIMNNGATQ